MSSLAVFGLVLVLVFICWAVTFMEAPRWLRYALGWRPRIGNTIRLGLRSKRRPDTGEEEPGTLVLMREKRLDEELLRLVAELREPPYDPARSRNETEARSIAEF